MQNVKYRDFENVNNGQCIPTHVLVGFLIKHITGYLIYCLKDKKRQPIQMQKIVHIKNQASH